MAFPYALKTDDGPVRVLYEIGYIMLIFADGRRAKLTGDSWEWLPSVS